MPLSRLRLKLAPECFAQVLSGFEKVKIDSVKNGGLLCKNCGIL